MNDKQTVPPLRFGFGRNWRQFLSTIDEASILRAVDSLQSFLKLNSLEDKRFLDVGCGSGLFSLAARRMKADELSIFLAISYCVFEAHCLLKAEDFEDIIFGILRNNTILPTQKSHIFAIYASYMDKVRGNLHNAIELQKQAISTEPAILNNYRSLIKFYAKANNYDALDQALKELKKRDRFNVYNNFTSTYETLLLNLHEDPSIQEEKDEKYGRKNTSL